MTRSMNEKRAQAFLFVSVMICLAYFYHPSLYDNATTRIALSCSLATERSTRIDAYADRTEDKAAVGGHFYCDKAPGLSLLGAPIVYAIGAVTKQPPCAPDRFDDLQYALSLLLLGIPTAFGVLLLYGILRRMGTGAAGAFLLALSWPLGTSAFTYATHFYDHQFAAVLTLSAFFLIYRREKSGGDFRPGEVALCGLLLGWAAITEYTSAVTSVILTIYLFAACRNRARFLWFIPAALAPMALLGWYNHASFGSVFSLGYFHESNAYFKGEMSRGLGGLTYPRAGRLIGVLLSPERGLFWGSPFLLGAIPGFYYLLKRREKFAVVCFAIVAARLLIVSSYYEPMGGFSPSSRFLVPALPFLIPAVAAFWSVAAPWLKGVAAGLCFHSIAIQLLLNATEPHAPTVFGAPLTGYALRLTQLGYRTSNGGVSLGLPYWVSLGIPAAAILLFIAYIYDCVRVKERGWIPAAVAAGVAATALTCYFFVGLNMKPTKEHLARFYVGAAMNQQGHPGAAAAEFRAAIRDKPEFMRARFHLGTAYVKMGRFDSAAKEFREVTRREPNSFQPRLSLAAAEMLAGQTDKAKEDLSAALRIRPNDPLAIKLKNMLEKQ